MLSLRCFSDSQVEILLGNFTCNYRVLSSQSWRCRFGDSDEETKAQKAREVFPGHAASK